MKLHLGCGNVNIEGFINIDVNEGKHIHIVGDVSDLSMFSDNSVDLIYASALFQYFDFIQGEVCLKEWCRILKPGGILRISTVDFDKLLEVYSATNKDIDKIIGPMYGRIDLNNKNMEGDKIYHKSIYTKKKLISSLEKSGFSKVQPYDWKQSIHLDYDDQSQSYYPHMDKDNGIHIMQNWEAIK
jgi:predicted SAM-dependent methyltransferase